MRPLGSTWPAHGMAAAPRGVHECMGAASRHAAARRRKFAATAAAFAPAAPKIVGKTLITRTPTTSLPWTRARNGRDTALRANKAGPRHGGGTTGRV